MTRKGIQWTPKQQEIAGLFELGQTALQLKEMGFGNETIYKVKNALAKGEQPPEPNYDNAQVDDEEQEEKKDVKDAGSGGNGGNGGNPRNTGVGARVETIAGASVIKLIPRVFTCDYTPIMRAAREAAINEWDWDPNMKFEDFLDTVLHTFYLDRGLILAGYTKVTDESTEGKEVFSGS